MFEFCEVEKPVLLSKVSLWMHYEHFLPVFTGCFTSLFLRFFFFVVSTKGTVTSNVNINDRTLLLFFWLNVEFGIATLHDSDNGCWSVQGLCGTRHRPTRSRIIGGLESWHKKKKTISFLGTHARRSFNFGHDDKNVIQTSYKRCYTNVVSTSISQSCINVTSQTLN